MSDELADVADRHFRPDPQGALAEPGAARQARVLIAIAPDMAVTKAGQDALWMLANLLCRQFRLVTGIAFDIPPRVELLPRVAAFGAAPTLRETVAGSIRLVARDHVVVDEDIETCAIEIFVGRPVGPPRAPVRLMLLADGWRLFLGRTCPTAEPPRSGITFGPYLAACFAAGEVFKRLRGIKPGKGELIGEEDDLCLSVWTGRTAVSWDQLDPDPRIGRTDFPPLYFAGAGAVAQAAALAIAGLPDASGHATVVDPEALDLTNRAYPV